MYDIGFDKQPANLFHRVTACDEMEMLFLEMLKFRNLKKTTSEFPRS